MPTEPIKDYPIAKSLCQAGTPALLVDRRKSVAGGTSGGGGRGTIGATKPGGGVRRTPWAGTTGTIGVGCIPRRGGRGGERPQHGPPAVCRPLHWSEARAEDTPYRHVHASPPPPPWAEMTPTERAEAEGKPRACRSGVGLGGISRLAAGSGGLERTDRWNRLFFYLF
ncbi:unnamed protein product [Boreogadus saida]